MRRELANCILGCATKSKLLLVRVTLPATVFVAGLILVILGGDRPGRGGVPDRLVDPRRARERVHAAQAAEQRRPRARGGAPADSWRSTAAGRGRTSFSHVTTGRCGCRARAGRTAWRHARGRRSAPRAPERSVVARVNSSGGVAPGRAPIVPMLMATTACRQSSARSPVACTRASARFSTMPTMVCPVLSSCTTNSVMCGVGACPCPP